ncbi:MAG: asparagine synthetase B, partial [Chloroflexi bacterium]|nr:asparagine synthetase B [Chloroflexota bacterium]
MSGIAGILNFDGTPPEPTTLQRMTEVVAHRGPDGIRYWLNGPIGLAHLQFCTTPESLRERQPWTSQDGRFVLVCDGRLDNREELLRELQAASPVDKAVTDAELIFIAYQAWGSECVKRFVGDFAFALWDAERRALFCARDPIGVRGFHYYYDGRRFVFGTEIQQVLRHPDVPADLNMLMMGLHLTGDSGDGEVTFYRHVRRLKGGYTLTISDNKLTLDEYWWPKLENPIRSNDGACEEQFRAVFGQAVQSSLRSQHPVSVMLSGGLDSSSIVCTAETLRRQDPQGLPPLHAFSYDFPPEQAPDSPHYLHAMQEQYGFPLHWIDARNFWGLQGLGDHRPPDEPFVLPYDAQWRRTFDHIHDRGMRVMLTGIGGDDVIAISPMVQLRDLLRSFRLVALRRELASMSSAARRRTVKRLWPALTPRWARALLPHRRKAKPTWLRQDFLDRWGHDSWHEERRGPPLAYPNGHAQVVQRAF